MRSGKRILKTIGAEFIKQILGQLSRVVPVEPGRVVLSSWPDFDENILAIAEEEVRRNSKLTFILNDPMKGENEYIRHHQAVSKWSTRGLFEFLRAERTYFTHGLYNSKNYNPLKSVINVWHGMPIKKIGLMSDDDYKAVEADIHIATSAMFQKIISASFGVDPDQVKIVGLPRNDYILSSAHEIDPDLIVWLPTYRKSKLEGGRRDSDEALEAKNFLGINLIQFSIFLKKMNKRLIIVPHPLEKINIPVNISENIQIMTRDLLPGRSLYRLLGKASMLISDASSVIIDYVLTERPIIVYFPDEPEYKKRRGLNFDLRDLGFLVTRNTRDIFKLIENRTGTTNYIKNIDLMHSFRGTFTRRLLDQIRRGS